MTILWKTVISHFEELSIRVASFQMNLDNYARKIVFRRSTATRQVMNKMYQLDILHRHNF